MRTDSLRGWVPALMAACWMSLLAGCGGGGLDPFGGGAPRNRNADVTLDLGPAAKLKDRVITMSGTIRPDVFTNDDPGTLASYNVRLEFATGSESNFRPATLLLAPGISLTEPIPFPVGAVTPFTIKWDRDADISQEVEARTWLRLTLTQAADGSGLGSATRGPKELDVRSGDGCGDKTPRITQTSILIPRNVASTAVIPTQFGTPPLSFTVNEPLPNGLTLEPDGRITGTPSSPFGPILRLITVTDACQARSDQAWVTIAVP